jgi:hypothetical protein
MLPITRPQAKTSIVFLTLYFWGTLSIVFLTLYFWGTLSSNILKVGQHEGAELSYGLPVAGWAHEVYP